VENKTTERGRPEGEKKTTAFTGEKYLLGFQGREKGGKRRRNLFKGGEKKAFLSHGPGKKKKERNYFKTMLEKEWFAGDRKKSRKKEEKGGKI